jgi:hypothetical protein
VFLVSDELTHMDEEILSAFEQVFLTLSLPATVTRFSSTLPLPFFDLLCKSLMPQDVQRCEQQISQKRKLHDNVLSRIEAPIPAALPVVLRHPVSVLSAKPHAPALLAPDYLPVPVVAPTRTTALSPFHPINEHHSLCSIRETGTFFSTLHLLPQFHGVILEFFRIEFGCVMSADNWQMLLRAQLSIIMSTNTDSTTFWANDKGVDEPLAASENMKATDLANDEGVAQNEPAMGELTAETKLADADGGAPLDESPAAGQHSAETASTTDEADPQDESVADGSSQEGSPAAGEHSAETGWADEADPQDESVADGSSQEAEASPAAGKHLAETGWADEADPAEESTAEEAASTDEPDHHPFTF